MPAATQVLKEGRYSVEQELRSRPNRKFFQAYDTHEETAVSIVAVGNDAASGRSVLSFDQLTAAIARFKHTYALGLRDSFVQAGVQYLVTDLIDGPDMATVLEDEKQSYMVPQVAFWGESLLEVLHGLHTFRPVTVFQAVRPEALIMRPDGDVSLLLSEMFGGDSVIRRSGAAGLPNRSIAYEPLEKLWSGLDAASQKVIIKHYDEASERALKQEMDARSDIFSVGATLYHLVTGRQPVDALERSIEIIDGNPDPLESPHNIDPSIPVEVSDVIMKAMEIKREFRFDSAAIMRQVLRTAVVRAKERGEDISAPEAQSTPPQNETRPQRSEPSAAEKHGAINSNAEVSKAPNKAAGPNPGPSSQPAPVLHSGIVKDPAVTGLAAADPDDDLLGILTPTPPPTAEASPAARAVVLNGPAAEVVAFPAKAVSGPETRATSASAAGSLPSENPEISLFSESAAPRSSKGLAFAAAAAVMVCIVGAGGWFYFGKSSAASMAPTAIEQTAETETQAAMPRPEPSAEPAVLTEREAPAVETPVAEPDISQPARTSASPQRTRKPVVQAAKPAQKKAVTVDDLINDN